MTIHFLIKSFLKNGSLSLDPYNIDKKNQVLKLLAVTAAVELLPSQLGSALVSSLL